jgi:WD40 repeat protein
VGQRFAGLKALKEAAALARELDMDESFFQDLRNETIACLALADVNLVQQWDGCPAGFYDAAFDADLRRYARFDRKNNVEVRQVEDDRLLARLHNATAGARWASFSPGGSLLTVAYGGGSIEEITHVQVWDWQRKEVVFQTLFPVRCLPCFSPDGSRLVVGARDGTVAVYRVDGWTEAARFKASVPALYLAWHPDGTRLAVSDYEAQVIEVWDTTTTALQYRVSAPGVQSLGWHPHGELLAAGCRDGSSIHLYNGATGGEHLVLQGHKSGVTRVNFAADGDLLVSASWDGTSRLWCPWTGRELLRFWGGSWVSRDGRRLASGAGHALAVWDVDPGREYLPLPPRRRPSWRPDTGVSVSPDGRWAATRGPGWGQVRIRHAHSGKLEKVLQQGDGVTRPDFSPDRRWLMIATGTEVSIWEPGTWRLERQFVLEQGRTLPAATAFAPDGSILAVVASRTTVSLFETRTWKLLARLQGADDDLIEHMTFTPDGASLLVSSWGGSATRVWDLRRIREQLAAVGLDWDLPPNLPARAADEMEASSFVGHTARVFWVGFSLDGRTAFSTSFDKTLRAWDASTGKELRCFRGHTDEVYGAALSPDGRRLLSGSQDGTVRLWDVASGKQLNGQEGMGRVTSVAFARDGRRALITNFDGLTLLWDVDDWKELRRIQFPVGLWSVAFSPDDSQAVIAGGTGGPDSRPILRLWDVNDGKELDRFELPKSGGLRGTVFSPDGNRILTAGLDGDLRLLDVTTGKVIRQFHGHEGGAKSAAFSPDGHRALSTGVDGAARLWDVRTGKELAHFRTFADGEVRGVAFSPDGRSALCGGIGGEVWLLRLPPEEETPPKDK